MRSKNELGNYGWRRTLATMTLLLAAVGLLPLTSQAQSPAAPPPLTLAQAEALALKANPQLAAYQLRALAQGQATAVQRSAYAPTLTGELTATAADRGTIIAAGELQTSSLSSRSAAGLDLSQLLTDFGRTADLVHAARLQQAAYGSLADNARAEVILSVRQAYYHAAAALAVHQATQAALQSRQLLLRQITALAASQLKSSLDVEFAQVLVSQAELANVQAQDDVGESWSGLAAAMGQQDSIVYSLASVATPAPPPDAAVLIAQAMARRPDLQALDQAAAAAHQQAKADQKLSDPTLSALAVLGAIPYHDTTVARGEDAAAGINLSIPIFNGGRFAAEHAESELRAQAGDKDAQNLRVLIAQQIRDAWLEANTAFQDLAVTDRLTQEADRALELAQARYDNGLGSIVELNQAQLSQTSAQIQAAGARSAYLSRRAALDYAAGLLP